MNSSDYAKYSEKYQRTPKTNVWRAQTPSASLDLKISIDTEETKFATPWLYVKSELKSNIPIVHASLSLVAASVIPEI